MEKKEMSFRKIKSINRDSLREELSRSDLCTNFLSYSLEILVNLYNNTLTSTLNRHAPVITKTVTKRPTVPWFNQEVKDTKKERRRAERKWRKPLLQTDLLVFKAKKNQATGVMKRARADYYSNFTQDLGE